MSGVGILPGRHETGLSGAGFPSRHETGLSTGNFPSRHETGLNGVYTPSRRGTGFFGVGILPDVKNPEDLSPKRPKKKVIKKKNL